MGNEERSEQKIINLKKYIKFIIIIYIISVLFILSCTVNNDITDDDLTSFESSVNIVVNEDETNEQYPGDTDNTGNAEPLQYAEIHEYPDFYAVSEYDYLSDDQKMLYDVCALICKEQIADKEYLFDKVSWYDFKIVQNILMANFSPFEQLLTSIIYLDDDTHQADLTIYGLYLYQSPDYDPWLNALAEYEIINAKAEEILSEITYDGTEADLAYKIAAWLVENVVYSNNDIGVDNTCYGALIKNRAVCDGYAKAYDFLCKKAGLESIYITGEQGDWWHAWNMLKIDGKWYHIDTTWMTSDNMAEYFMMDDETAYLTHYNPCYYFNPVLYKNMMPTDDF